MSDEVGIWLITDFFARAAGLMLLGVVAYRRGFVTAELDRQYLLAVGCRRLLVWNSECWGRGGVATRDRFQH